MCETPCPPARSPRPHLLAQTRPELGLGELPTPAVRILESVSRAHPPRAAVVRQAAWPTIQTETGPTHGGGFRSVLTGGDGMQATNPESRTPGFPAVNHRSVAGGAACRRLDTPRQSRPPRALHG